MAARQQKKEQVHSSSPKLGETAAPAEKTLEHQEHFAEGRSHGGILKEQPGIEGYPETGTRDKQRMKKQLGVSSGRAEQGLDIDESTG